MRTVYDDFDAIVSIAHTFAELDAALAHRCIGDPKALATSRVALADVLTALCEELGVDGYLDGDPDRVEATRATARALLGCASPT